MSFHVHMQKTLPHSCFVLFERAKTTLWMLKKLLSVQILQYKQLVVKEAIWKGLKTCMALSLVTIMQMLNKLTLLAHLLTIHPNARPS